MNAAAPRRAIVFARAPASGPAMTRMGAGALVVVVVGLVLGSAVDAVSPVPAEERILAAIADDRSPVATAFFHAVTTAGDLWVVALAVAVLSPPLRRVTGGWQAAWLLWAALLGSLLVTAVIKVAVGRARPLEALVAADSGAFPSGHTSRAAAVLGLCAWAVILLARRPGVRAAGATAFAAGVALMGFSRLYLGVHWPSDVTYGLVVGLAWLAVMVWAVRPRAVPAPAVAPTEPHIAGPT